MSDKWKMIFGFCLLLSIDAVAMILALGHVEEKTSYGLRECLTALFILSGGWAAWAFGVGKDKT